MARQADAAVLAQYGETSVLATVVAEKSARPGIDFFPLTVNYQEKTYAAGKIPGGYFKREGRPTEKETLTSRLIDRPIRPLFMEGFKHETQVVVTVLSHDMENDPDIVGMVAASAALDAVRPALPRPDRRRPGRRRQRPVRAQSHDRRDGRKRARPRRGRHRRRRDDGGIGGQGAARAADAGGRHVRPARLPAGDPGHHQAGREGGQGAVGFPAARQVQVSSRRPRRWSRPICARPSRRRRSRSVTSWSRRRTPRSRRSSWPPMPMPASRCCWAPCSRASSRTSCAATSSAPASASTAAT